MSDAETAQPERLPLLAGVLVSRDMPDFKLHGIPIGNKRWNVERKGTRVKILPA